MILSLLTPPGTSPVTLDEVKAQARVEVDDDDVLLQGFIDAATQYAERETQRAFIEQQWEMILDCFPHEGEIEIPLPPLISVDEIAYLNSQAVETPWDVSNYRVIAPAGPYAGKGRVVLRNGKAFPTGIINEAASIYVRFTAGYGTYPESVPQMLKTAIQVHVAEMYENRESTVLTGAVIQEVPFSVKNLLWPFVVEKFGL